MPRDTLLAASDSAAQPRIAAAAGLSDFARRPRLPLSEAASPPPPPPLAPLAPLAPLPLAPLPLAALASCDDATGRASKRTYGEMWGDAAGRASRTYGERVSEGLWGAVACLSCAKGELRRRLFSLLHLSKSRLDLAVIASPENETTSPPCLWKQRIRSEK